MLTRRLNANAEFSRNEANSSIQTGHISHPYVKKPLFSARNTAGIYERTNNSAAPVKEIFIVREPLRLITFTTLGDYRIRTLTKEGKAERGKVQIGQKTSRTRASGDAFVGTLFTYHGNEKTVPPRDNLPMVRDTCESVSRDAWPLIDIGRPSPMTLAMQWRGEKETES